MASLFPLKIPLEKLTFMLYKYCTFLHGVGRQEFLQQQVPQNFVKIFRHLVLLLPE
jgi:hypothetical protein